jgi:cytochrome P450
VDFMIGGSDTTNITLNWILLFLVLNQDIQDKVRAELDSVTNNGSRLITMEDKINTPYTEATIAEIQRRASIFPAAVPHKVTKDTTFEGFTLPKGTIIMPFVQGSMHNPLNFPQPMKCNPDRFLDSNTGKFVPNPKVRIVFFEKLILLKMIAREKDSGFGWKIGGF